MAQIEFRFWQKKDSIWVPLSLFHQGPPSLPALLSNIRIRNFSQDHTLLKGFAAGSSEWLAYLSTDVNGDPWMALMLSGYLAHVCTERLAWPMLYNLMLCLPSQILYSYGSGSDSPNNNNNNIATEMQ